MDIPNLSLVFGPNLLRSPKGALNDLRDTTYQTGIVMILIKAPPGSDVDQLMQVAINPSAAVAPRRKMSYPKRSDPSIQAAMDTMVNTDTLSTEDAFKLFDIVCMHAVVHAVVHAAVQSARERVRWWYGRCRLCGAEGGFMHVCGGGVTPRGGEGRARLRGCALC